MRKVSGFTIIELVVVITILGILAAVALPKFFDIQNDARSAAAQGVAGAVASGAAINYGAYLAKGSITGGVVQVTACTQAALTPLLTGNLWPDTNITVTAGSPTFASVANGEAAECVFSHTGGGASKAVGIIKLSS